MQINKNIICKNEIRIYYDYKVKDKFMINNRAVLKYKPPYKWPFQITQCLTNDMVILEYGTIKIDIIYVVLSPTNQIKFNN